MIPRTDSGLTFQPTANLLSVGGIAITNTTLVSNLNADRWDGQHLPPLATNAAKVLTVNATNTALEWSESSGGNVVLVPTYTRTTLVSETNSAAIGTGSYLHNF